MRHSIPILLLLALGVHAAALAQATPMAGQVLVKIREDAPSAAVRAEALLAGVKERYGIIGVAPWLDTNLLKPSPRAFHRGNASTSRLERGLLRIVVVSFASGIDPLEVAQKISSIDGIEYAEPVYRRSINTLPNDPLNVNQTYLDQVHAPEGWGIEQADSNVIIAIVDTGIDPLHPDLRGALWTNRDETGLDDLQRDRRSNGIDDDGNGLVDDWRGYDFAGRDSHTPDNDPSPGHWHGTHVAGIAGATGDNGIGVTGVGFGSKLMAVKIADDQTTGDPLLAGGFNAIVYASKMGAHIINCSWGGPGRSRAEQEVIDLAAARGSLVVASAGNDGVHVELYPASYSGVLSVASVMGTDRRSSFSNFNTMVGIAAPGENIYSTMTGFKGSYGTASGTSMSAPIVSGAAALVASRYPSLSGDEIAAVLRAGSDDIDDGNPAYHSMLGTGRLNIERSLLNGPNAHHVVIMTASARDENGDGLIDPLERVEISAELRNVLLPTTDLQLSIGTRQGEVPLELVSGTDNFGIVPGGEFRETHSGSLVFRAPKDVQLDYVLPLVLTATNNDKVVGSLILDLVVNPNFSTMTNQIVTATFTGNGRIGFNDFPRNSQGKGFRLETSDNLLAEAGLIIGTTKGRLVDVVRTGDAGFQARGLQTTEPYRWAIEDRTGAAVGHSRFDDAQTNPERRVGVDVAMTTYAWPGKGAGNQVIVLYTIRNSTPARIDSLFAGLYLDWDIGAGGSDNQVAFDPSRRLGITTNIRKNELPVVGTMLLSDLPMNFTALDNAHEPLREGFFATEKFATISRGIARETSSIGDCSMSIGAGPISLAPGAETVVAFSLMAAPTLADLQNTADEGKQIFRRLGFTPGGPLSLPTAMDLTVGPNPFGERLSIGFSLAEEQTILLEIFNSRGERVDMLAEGRFPRGAYNAAFEPGAGTDGVYFVRLHTSDGSIVRKTIRVDN